MLVGVPDSHKKKEKITIISSRRCLPAPPPATYRRVESADEENLTLLTATTPERREWSYPVWKGRWAGSCFRCLPSFHATFNRTFPFNLQTISSFLKGIWRIPDLDALPWWWVVLHFVRTMGGLGANIHRESGAWNQTTHSSKRHRMFRYLREWAHKKRFCRPQLKPILMMLSI